MPSASAVSVFVMDCTTTGWADPTGTPPTITVAVDRREGTLIDDHGRGRPSDRHSACSRPRRERASGDRAGRGRQVWIVEDEPASATLAAELCEGVGRRGLGLSGAAPVPCLATRSVSANRGRPRLASRARAERGAVPRDSPPVPDSAGDLLDRAHRRRAAIDDHRGRADDRRRQGRRHGAIRARPRVGNRRRRRRPARARRARARGRRSSHRTRTSS